jgi:acyl-coenzyme A thioesterase PaaI-like protein
VLKPGSVVSFVAARIVDAHDRLIATASSTYLIKARNE